MARADRGGTLNPAELLQVAGVLRCAREVKSYCDGDYQQTVLDPLFFALSTNRYLEEQITGAILSVDEIADSASAELTSIRRHMRLQSDRIKQTLQRIISSPGCPKRLLQEPIITMRADRYVVPVKSDHKSAVPGLVHDVSSSGSTFFIEPASVVEANNKLRELELAEEREIARILAEFSADVANHKDAIDMDFTMLVQLDEIFARARYSFAIHGIEPETRTDGAIHLNRDPAPAHPGGEVLHRVRPAGEDFDTLIITGPNTGGKTVTLKTLGLHVPSWPPAACTCPADGRQLRAASIRCPCSRTSATSRPSPRTLSTFSAHMTDDRAP